MLGGEGESVVARGDTTGLGVWWWEVGGLGGSGDGGR